VLLVISRDPAGKEKDNFFFTTDLSFGGRKLKLCSGKMSYMTKNRVLNRSVSFSDLNLFEKCEVKLSFRDKMTYKDKTT
jgi:hypothetical protein